MLDKLCKKILKILEKLCNLNSYSIIEINEILQLLSLDVEMDVLCKYIKFLSDNEYIDVKYMDDKQVCLAILPKAKGIEEEAKEDKKLYAKCIRMMIISSLLSLIFGFVGAFLGSYFF